MLMPEAAIRPIVAIFSQLDFVPSRSLPAVHHFRAGFAGPLIIQCPSLPEPSSASTRRSVHLPESNLHLHRVSKRLRLPTCWATELTFVA